MVFKESFSNKWRRVTRATIFLDLSPFPHRLAGCTGREGEVTDEVDGEKGEDGFGSEALIYCCVKDIFASPAGNRKRPISTVTEACSLSSSTFLFSFRKRKGWKRAQSTGCENRLPWEKSHLQCQIRVEFT